MEQQTIEHEIVKQILELMDKSGFGTIAPVLAELEQHKPEIADTIFLNLKTLNAKYDKNEAINQIRCLMDKYNIQLDQLTDQRVQG
jgi:division protein CdvB (Snf7/Vps24/ESCRT-III family)